MNVDAILTTAQKQDVVTQRLWSEGAPLSSKVRVVYNAQRGADFEVERSGLIVTVIFSAPLSSPRLSEVIKRCAVAIEQVMAEVKSPITKTGHCCIECGAREVWAARRINTCLACGVSFKVEVVR